LWLNPDHQPTGGNRTKSAIQRPGLSGGAQLLEYNLFSGATSAVLTPDFSLDHLIGIVHLIYAISSSVIIPLEYGLRG